MAKRIFLLEDDEGIRQVIELILNLENYEVTSFENVEKFMAANPYDVPDLFILDVMLPDGNGIEVCKELSTLQKDVPVVMMSAHLTSADIALSCSEASFIPKPFDLNTLINTVKRLMKDE
ncbi:response regulator [Pedobacter sp. G11]|uniref:response regulator n=1 Tax=Pedobacter sp. G11 TaxID=2482728 RepID=UPI001FEF4940|nr:response regulator [Pedobacter sp. G11]